LGTFLFDKIFQFESCDVTVGTQFCWLNSTFVLKVPWAWRH
jgi:hypothetical protein